MAKKTKKPAGDCVAIDSAVGLASWLLVIELLVFLEGWTGRFVSVGEIARRPVAQREETAAQRPHATTLAGGARFETAAPGNCCHSAPHKGGVAAIGPRLKAAAPPNPSDGR